jgi:hypothetical protein
VGQIDRAACLCLGNSSVQAGAAFSSGVVGKARSMVLGFGLEIGLGIGLTGQLVGVTLLSG